MVRIAKRKVHRRWAAARAERELEPLAYSIAEFAWLHGISVDHYFRMARLGQGPRVMKVGHRSLISRESAADWRREREEPRKPTAAEAVNT
jgi:hypothetical protein